MKNAFFSALSKVEEVAQVWQGKGWGGPATAVSEVRQCLSFNSKPNMVIDCGANKGKWADALLKLVQPQMLVLVEPDPSNAAFLRSKFDDVK